MNSSPSTKRLLSIIEKLAWIVERTAAIPCIIAIGAMTAIVILGVVFRYVLVSPLGWTEEAARYLMIWAASLAVSMGIMKREHVGITLVVQKLPPGLERWCTVGVHLAILLFLWVLTQRGYYMAINGKNQISPLLGISMTWSLAAIPIAGFLALLQTIFLIIIKIVSPSISK
ncbi:MAG: TRAP transporter small permease [Deltaproteobacteria bacterium]|nr:TRAP transporter small permease [Deltaproteobacteria bacterium]